MNYANAVLYFLVSSVINYVNGNAVLTHCNDVPGYYWRDYTGEIPGDAIPGGTDHKGRRTYIGQTLHPGASILPGKISKGNHAMFYEYGGAERSSTEDVKILCSQHPGKLQWVSTKNGRSVTSVGIGKTLILGGHDSSRPLAIGRKTISTGELTVSKVLIVNYNFENIYLAHNGKGWSDSGPYEVLVYNPAGFVNDQNGAIKKLNLEEDETIKYNMIGLISAKSEPQVISAGRPLVENLFGSEKVTDFATDLCDCWPMIQEIDTPDEGTKYADKLRKLIVCTTGKILLNQDTMNDRLLLSLNVVGTANFDPRPAVAEFLRKKSGVLENQPLKLIKLGTSSLYFLERILNYNLMSSYCVSY